MVSGIIYIFFKREEVDITKKKWCVKINWDALCVSASSDTNFLLSSQDLIRSSWWNPFNLMVEASD